MENRQETPEKPRLKDFLGSRGPAVIGVFFLGGPAFFILWIYIANPDISAGPPIHVWAAPIAATVFLSLAVLLLPERIVRLIGKVFGWIPYV